MDPATQQLFQQLGLSALLGLLVGFERERSENQLGGVRTFPLVTVLGTICALLGQHFGGWVVAAGFIGVATFVVIGNVAKLYRGDADPGVTTEAAMLLMFGVGAYIVVGTWLAAVAVASGVAVLLQFKPEMHGFVRRFGDGESRAIMRFVLIACIILPVLPDQGFGPYAVFNPFETWLLVVMIVGISLAGYIAYKFLGANVGTILGGLLGGAISSTATTVSYSRRAAGQPQLAVLGATVILIATTVVYLRVLAEIRLMAPAFLPIAAGPVLVLLALALVPAIVLWWFSRRTGHQMPEQDDPAEFRAALFFALMYVAVLFGMAAAKNYFGQSGLYTVAVLSGLTDMDAITLSASRMVSKGEVAAGTGWRMIVLAAMANLVFKAGLVASLGNWRMFAWVAALFGLSLIGGGVLIFAWPDSIRLPISGLEQPPPASDNEPHVPPPAAPADHESRTHARPAAAVCHRDASDRRYHGQPAQSLVAAAERALCPAGLAERSDLLSVAGQHVR